MSSSATISSIPFSPSLSRHNYRVSFLNRTPSPPSFKSSTFARNWRLLCFRNENLPADTNGSEFKEDKLTEDLTKLESDKSKELKKDWLATLHTVITSVVDVKPWTVPWTVKTIVQVMLLWISSFWLVGSWIVPFLASIAGFRKDSLTFRGQALYSLLIDIAEGVVGIAILHRCLAKFKPLSSDWFKFELKGKWPLDVSLGCLLFPLINQLSQVNLNLLPVLQWELYGQLCSMGANVGL